MNHKPGLLAIVVRSTTGEPCTPKDIGKVVRLRRCGLMSSPFAFFMDPPIRGWEVDDGPFRCPHCGDMRVGYAEADLDVIPPDDSVVSEDMAERPPVKANTEKRTTITLKLSDCNPDLMKKLDREIREAIRRGMRNAIANVANELRNAGRKS